MYGIWDTNISDKLLDSLFCPQCGQRLVGLSLLDSFVRGLRCAKGHRYFVDLRAPTTALTDNAGRLNPKYPCELPYIERTRFWITNARCRRHLVNALATTLRRIYELATGGCRLREDISSFPLCPRCTAPLVCAAEQNDGYTTALECQHHHRYWQRGSLSGSIDDQHLVLWHEFADAQILRNVEFYLRDNADIRRCVHADVRSFLTEYRETVKY
jgi:hypothetical protein